MDQALEPDVLADVAQALYAVQDPVGAALVSRAEVIALKRAEVETVLGALRRAGVIVTVRTRAADDAGASTRLISREQIGEIFGLRRSATYDLTQRPGFPTPVVLSPKCHRWPVEEVLAFAAALRHQEVGLQRPRLARTGPAQGIAWPASGARVTGRIRPARERKAAP